jgi:hypothetical protein
MSATGLEVFDRTVQTTNAWLKEIMEITGPDRHRAYGTRTSRRPRTKKSVTCSRNDGSLKQSKQPRARPAPGFSTRSARLLTR